MKYCRECKVNVNTQKGYCPLCGEQLSQIDDTVAIEFPAPKKYISEKKMSVVAKIFFCLSAFAVIFSALINFLTFEYAPIWWSVVVLISVIYAWSLVKRAILTKSNIAKIFFNQLLLLSVLLLAIDGTLTGFSMWSVCLAIPFLSIGVSIAIMVTTLAKLLYYRNSLHYAVGILLFGVLQMFSLIFAPVKWAIVGCGGVSVVIFVVLLVVCDKRMFVEMEKRLHF